eukprot:6185749-Pleurochrysis_carterae.AAC.1
MLRYSWRPTANLAIFEYGVVIAEPCAQSRASKCFGDMKNSLIPTVISALLRIVLKSRVDRTDSAFLRLLSLALAAYYLHATNALATGTLRIMFIYEMAHQEVLTHMSMASRPSMNVRVQGVRDRVGGFRTHICARMRLP